MCIGSLIDGSVYRADLTTGIGRFVTRGQGPQQVGLKLGAYGRLLLAGGERTRSRPAASAGAPAASSGRPTAGYGDRLYVVSARFGADWSEPATASTSVSCPW
ncbi:hypothetical protein OG239_37060 [Streptomyces sp. NBC_00868]|uniref:hypothetical protein n=1 Tax=unclassified Streptomyces TaxID=2593676 RepID=UPI00324E510E|nr:hypothetical protein OG239_37060 [Streptomyces sp. NBC_00868]